MADLPPVTIIATTWLPPGRERERLVAFQEAAASWRKNLVYDGPIHLHIADDGTAWDPWVSRLKDELLAWDRGGTAFSRQEAHGVGASLNAGCAAVWNHSAAGMPLALYAVDDWELTAPFDLTPWARLLNQYPGQWDIIRLGPPHPGIRGVVTLTEQGWLLDLEPYGFRFSFRPMLFRSNLYKTVGPFLEDASSLVCEDDYNRRCDEAETYIAYALPTPWAPIETGALSDIDPRSRS